MRDRDQSGRPQNARPRDALGRPLSPGAPGVAPLPDDIDARPAAVVDLANRLLDENLPFQAHEVLEAAWKAAAEPESTAWKGMAQLAVSLTHRLRGNAAGAGRLRERGLLNLATGDLPQIAWPLRDRLLRLTDGR